MNRKATSSGQTTKWVSDKAASKLGGVGMYNLFLVRSFKACMQLFLFKKYSYLHIDIKVVAHPLPNASLLLDENVVSTHFIFMC
jgi:hypothetical protein